MFPGLMAVPGVESLSQCVRSIVLQSCAPEGIPDITQCTLEDSTASKLELDVFINASTVSCIQLILMQNEQYS